MKTAVIISGNVRTFRYVHKRLSSLYSKLENPEFFCSVVKEDGCEDMEIIRDYGKAEIEYVEQPDCEKEIWPGGFDFRMLNGGPYEIAPHASPQTILRSFWSQERAYKMAGGGFDCYVRLRPDVFFTNLDFCGLPEANECGVPWWAGWGGVNDRFAIMGSMAAQKYFSVYSCLPELLKECALHPECLLGRQLVRNGIKIVLMNVEFYALRPPDENGKLAQVPPNYSTVDIFNLVMGSRR